MIARPHALQRAGNKYSGPIDPAYFSTLRGLAVRTRAKRIINTSTLAGPPPNLNSANIKCPIWSQTANIFGYTEEENFRGMLINGCRIRTQFCGPYHERKQGFFPDDLLCFNTSHSGDKIICVGQAFAKGIKKQKAWGWYPKLQQYVRSISYHESESIIDPEGTRLLSRKVYLPVILMGYSS